MTLGRGVTGGTRKARPERIQSGPSSYCLVLLYYVFACSVGVRSVLVVSGLLDDQRFGREQQGSDGGSVGER